MVQYLLIIVVFISGAVLMALEIVGSRVLAPYFGSSIFVWGSLISVVLAALSLGYYWGGWLSARSPSFARLLVLLLIPGALIFSLPFIYPSVNLWIAGIDFGIRLNPKIDRRVDEGKGEYQHSRGVGGRKKATLRGVNARQRKSLYHLSERNFRSGVTHSPLPPISVYRGNIRRAVRVGHLSGRGRGPKLVKVNMVQYLLIIVVFISGAVLMALEIVGSRVLAPYFGSSIFVWGSLISVVLGQCP